MKRGVLSLLSVSGAELRLCPSNCGDVIVRFTVQVGQQQSGEQLALVEQVDTGELGLAGRLKIRCAPLDVGIPPQVIEPHIEWSCKSPSSSKRIRSISHESNDVLRRPHAYSGVAAGGGNQVT